MIHNNYFSYPIINRSRLQSHFLTLGVYAIKPFKYKPDKTASKRICVAFDWSIIKRTANSQHEHHCAVEGLNSVEEMHV
jgi:hypothetical protein